MIEQVQLTEGERRVLSVLMRYPDYINSTTLAEQLGERENRVASILNSLSVKRLVTLRTRDIESYTLTDEGREYAENGLPEMRLFDAVMSVGGESELDSAVVASGLDEKKKAIALSWARRLGWLKISRAGNRTILTAQQAQTMTPLTEVLIELKQGANRLPERLAEGIRLAKERALISTTTIKILEASISSEVRGTIADLITESSEGIGDLTPEILSSRTWSGKKFRPYNVEVIPPYSHFGRKHPYAEFNDWLREILVGLGFTEWQGPYVEIEFWNNDALFVPQDHVAREVQDQFRVTQPYDHGVLQDEEYYEAVKATHENGWKTGSTGWGTPFSRDITTRLCLRSHTTAVSVRYLREHRESPQKMFVIDRNFRAENVDARHAMEFDQCEGIIMDRGLTLRDLMGYISEICRRVGVKKVKFKPGQFPFTEPSVEGYAKHETLGWIEVAPGGIFRPEVTRPLGIKDTVLAWGIGSGRLYMAAMGISDIRQLHSRDLNWIRRAYFLR